MSTTAYQYTIFSKIKFGLSMLFRCFNCFHNVFEKIYFMAFAQQSCPNTIPFIYCPYCGDKIYALEQQPGGYNLLFTVDQTPLDMLTLILKGTNEKNYTIIWGDNKLSTGQFDGTIETFTHNYSETGNYMLKIFIDNDDLLYIDLKQENLIDTVPAIQQFPNIEYIHLGKNNLTGSLPPIDSMNNITTLNFIQNNLSGTIPSFANNLNLEKAIFAINLFSGTVPSVVGMSSLQSFNIQENQLTGSIPDIAGIISIYRCNWHGNQFSGSMPALGSLPNLDWFYVHENQLTGSMPNFSGLTAITRYNCSYNSIIGVTASTISLTFTYYVANDNLLTQIAVDQILSDFNDNLASRPGSGTINLGGTGNATPSAAGLVHKANIIAHGWTVTTN